MAKIKFDHLPLTEKERQSIPGIIMPVDRPKKSGCLTLLLIPIALSTSLLFSCEGSRSARMKQSFESAIDDYNNGDSSTLIVMIVLLLVVGVLWVIKHNKDK